MTYAQFPFFARRDGVAFFLFGCLVGLLAGGTFPRNVEAQQGPSLRSVERPIQVTVDPTYQRYERTDGQALTQVSTHLALQVPINTQLTVEAQAGVARMGGGGLHQVQGLTDATGRILYAQPLGDGSLVFSARVNVPVGKQRLDTAAVRTTRQIGQNYYDFPVSSFSRGLSVSPRVTWAYPVTDRLAVGVGVGYQHHRGFQPQAGQEGDYVPGDGIRVNGGADYKLAETSAIGIDVAMKRYAADRLNGARQFEAGTRMSGTLRYLHRSGFTTVRGVLRYANWEESEFGYQFGRGPRRGQVIPSHAMALSSLQVRLREGIRLSVRLSGHRYAQTIREGSQGDAKTVGRAYLSPAFDLGRTLTLSPHGQVTYGSYFGFGGGVRIVGAF